MHVPEALACSRDSARLRCDQSPTAPGRAGGELGRRRRSSDATSRSGSALRPSCCHCTACIRKHPPAAQLASLVQVRRQRARGSNVAHLQQRQQQRAQRAGGNLWQRLRTSSPSMCPVSVRSGQASVFRSWCDMHHTSLVAEHVNEQTGPWLFFSTSLELATAFVLTCSFVWMTMLMKPGRSAHEDRRTREPTRSEGFKSRAGEPTLPGAVFAASRALEHRTWGHV
jgi:hypothetical protein